MDWQNLIEDWVAERINRIIEEMGPDRRREYYREQRSVLQSTRLRFWMDYGWGIRRFEKFLLRIAHNNAMIIYIKEVIIMPNICLLYTSPSPRDTR